MVTASIKRIMFCDGLFITSVNSIDSIEKSIEFSIKNLRPLKLLENRQCSRKLLKSLN